ncbi:hypothetical protein LIER_42473 [Lithospermum erythrorhizon]|uniref:Uncharacterized protein n=1 Tax=Lithospermum erythrorhizon TaxID=34254 RepID=A0AAV3RS77_LITER
MLHQTRNGKDPNSSKVHTFAFAFIRDYHSFTPYWCIFSRLSPLIACAILELATLLIYFIEGIQRSTKLMASLYF